MIQVTSKMKLTDLNIDCLEGILEYLDLENLLNAADSNKRLCYASKFVYNRKYSSSKVKFYITYKTRQECLKRSKPISMSMDDINSIYVNNLKNILQLLRNFGHLISQIDYELFLPISGETSPYIIDYMNYFCHESLSDIKILMMDQDLLKLFKKPFTRVKTVEIMSEFLMQNNSLVRLFPKMEKLKLEVGRYATISECIANHFSYLKHFEINVMFSENYKKDQYIENFKKFLKLNPQLEYLSMDCGNEADIEILQVFGEREQNPKYLKLVDCDQFLNYSNEKKIHLRNVEHLWIWQVKWAQTDLGLRFLCDKLKSFEFGFDRQLDESIYEFFHNNSTIIKLKLGFWTSDDININYLKLAQSLPLLEEMTVLYGKLSVVEVCNILPLFKSIKYFHFVSVDEFDYKKLESLLSTWKIQSNIKMETNYITLKR